MRKVMPGLIFAGVFAISYGILAVLRGLIGYEATFAIALVGGLSSGVALWWTGGSDAR